MFNKICKIIILLSVLYIACHGGRAYQSAHTERLETFHVITQPYIVEASTERNKTLATHVEPMEFEVTAYCLEDYHHICNDGNCLHTATGSKPVAGVTIAVDPTIIPYGSKVYIDGMGLYIAEDTGGSIIGNRIDIAYNTHSEALEFGRQNLTIWVLTNSDK